MPSVNQTPLNRIAATGNGAGIGPYHEPRPGGSRFGCFRYFRQYAWRNAHDGNKADQFSEKAFSRRVVTHGGSELVKIAAKEGCAVCVVNQNLGSGIFWQQNMISPHTGNRAR